MKALPHSRKPNNEYTHKSNNGTGKSPFGNHHSNDWLKQKLIMGEKTGG